MGIVININGRGTVTPITESVRERVGRIHDGNGGEAFFIDSENNELYFSKLMAEGENPLEDGIITPLSALLSYANHNGLTVNGCWTIYSSCDDYDGITFSVADNKIQCVNARFINSFAEELVSKPDNQDKPVYTHDEATRIVELFENVLEEHNISIPSPEDDERGDDNDARIYGSVYGNLLDEVENALIHILEGKTGMVNYVYSGTL